jgi:hypothetical protein
VHSCSSLLARVLHKDDGASDDRTFVYDCKDCKVLHLMLFLLDTLGHAVSLRVPSPPAVDAADMTLALQSLLYVLTAKGFYKQLQHMDLSPVAQAVVVRASPRSACAGVGRADLTDCVPYAPLLCRWRVAAVATPCCSRPWMSSSRLYSARASRRSTKSARRRTRCGGSDVSPCSPPRHGLLLWEAAAKASFFSSGG